MYEVDFTGWVRTPEELQKIKNDWKYRLSLNYKRFYKAIKYRRFWQISQLFLSLVLNRHDF